MARADSTQAPSIGSNLFAENFSDKPYWWENTPRPQSAAVALPSRVDVLIVGSGYTGLCAAIQTTRGGRSTLVIDAKQIGWGCSTRNGGGVGSSLRPDFARLSKQYGVAKARQVFAEDNAALAWMSDFIRDEGIDCNFHTPGRFHGAHTPALYDRLARRLDDRPAGFELDAHVIPRSEQSSEIGSDFYHGGLVYRRNASLDPAAYHQGLLDAALRSGIQVTDHCPVRAIEAVAGGKGFSVDTERGRVTARDVVVATNGYTGAATPWQRRRIIPIGSYMIATEDIGEEQACALIPGRRHVTDTRRLAVYFRLSPDRRRLLFGSRVSLNETDVRVSAPRLHAKLTSIFPQLHAVRVTHAWMGFVAWTFQHMPHLGRHDGIWYSLGYCGAGVLLSSYFGTRIGQQVLGLEEGRTAIDNLPFRTRPLYHGRPWFLAASVWWYAQLDRMGM